MRDPFDFDLFTSLVAAELQLKAASFERRDLEEFMASLRPLILGDKDDPAWWASAFCEAQGATA